MKTALPSVLLALLVAATPLQAAKKKGGGGGAKPAAAAPATNPAAALEPYITHIDALLALKRPPKSPGPLFAQAQGRLAVLRQDFVTTGTAAAEAEKPKYSAAVVTCDALNGALSERQQTLGNLHASKSVTGTSKLEQGPRKDNLSQGVKGGELPRAVAEIEEGKRERAANRAAKAAAASNDNALNAMAVNRWNQRSAQLKQQILADYAKIR